MIVTQANFYDVVELLGKEKSLGLDTETYGLRMFHGDRIFSLILATDDEAYYFNFKQYPGLGVDMVLDSRHWNILEIDVLNDPDKIWYIQRAACFDLPMLWTSEHIQLAGEVHCTKEIHRLVNNECRDNSLEALLPQIGLSKDTSVDEYIMQNKLYTTIKIPGKAQSDKNKHFDKVPFDMISKYGEKDGTGTIALGRFQEKEIARMDAEQPELVASGRSVNNVLVNERRLVKTIFRMKTVGVHIDREYCARAIKYENDREAKTKTEFKRLTGHAYMQSSKLFEEIFKSEKKNWSMTKKGNPSFDADAIEKLEHPAAKLIVEMRDAKSKSDFYNGFLYHADSDGNVHPDFNAGGTVHGRFSSSNPNFQNLKKEDSDEEVAGEFTVRRAIKPRPGYVLIMPDYKQMEYAFALEQACKLLGYPTELAIRIAKGEDFHDVTRDLTKIVTGNDYVRKIMKVANFLTLYGGGPGALAENLKITFAQAKAIQMAIKRATPEITEYIDTIKRVGAERGFIVNWLGRRCYFQFKSMAYKAPNYHVSGGCADVVKVAMNGIDEYLLGKKSRMIMTVHDELPIEVHESEIDEVPKRVQEIMAGVYKSKFVPLTTSMEWSSKSLGDKIKGFPI